MVRGSFLFFSILVLHIFFWCLLAVVYVGLTKPTTEISVRAQSFTLLMADLYKDIYHFYGFSEFTQNLIS